jgi:hypothetical protein
MRFLCLAYGNEEDWKALSEEQRRELLAGDDVLRRRGATVAVVGGPTVVTAGDGSTTTRSTPYAEAPAPLVGFSLVEAEDIDEVVLLVAATPCAVAGGAIEVRPLVGADAG